MGNKETKENKVKRPFWKKSLRILAWFAAILIVLFMAIVLIVRSEWGQNLIVGEVTSFVSKKTDTKFSINKLYITFSGDILLDGLYVEDEKSDTLVYSKSLQADIPIWPIITGNPIAIDGVEWDGLTANVYRKDTINGFNYQFLIDAFTSDTTSTSASTDTTSSESMEIQVGDIDFSNFEVKYKDEVTGMDAELKLGKLHFEGDNIDLAEIKFEVEEIQIANTEIRYVQNKAFPPSEEDTTSSQLPYLSLGNLSLENVKAEYNSIPDGIEANIDLSKLELAVPMVDLENQAIEVEQFTLNNSDLALMMSSVNKKSVDTTKTERQSDTTNLENAPFVWPDWNVQVAEISLENNHIKYQNGNPVATPNQFNPDDIELKDFNFKSSDIQLSKENAATLNLNTLSFKEVSGFTLNNFGFEVSLADQQIEIQNFNVATPNSKINAELGTQFSSLQDFMDAPEQAYLTLQLSDFSLDLKDAYYFSPALEDDEYIKKLSAKKFDGAIDAEGKLSKLDLNNFIVNWGNQTSIETKGQFLNLTDPDALYADVQNFEFKSNKKDINQIIAEEELGIQLPQSIVLRSQLKGSLEDITTQTDLILPEGKVSLNGGFKNKNEISFDATLEVIDLAVGNILKNPEIGNIAFNMDVKGKGSTINTMNAELNSTFSKLELSGYDFSALELDGNLNSGKGTVNINYLDDNLDLAIDSKIELDSISPEVALDLNLNGADLMALGVTNKDIKAKLMMQANFKGNAERFKFDTQLTEGVAVYEKENLYLGKVDIAANIRKDSTSFDINSNFLNGNLRSNSGPEQIATAIQNQLQAYFTDSIIAQDSIQDPVKLKMDMNFANTKLISRLFIPEIKTMDTLDFNLKFNEEEKDLKANLNLPFINYSENTIDSLDFSLVSGAKDAKFKFGFIELSAGPIQMKRSYFDGDLKNSLLNLNFKSFDGEEEVYVVKTELSDLRQDLKIHFDSEKLIFQGQNWSIPEDNQLKFLDQEIVAQNFVFSQGNQKVRIANDLIQTEKNNIGLGFENFKLENIMALLNEEELIATGQLQGKIVVIDPFDQLGLNTDFKIEDLAALQTELGNLELQAKSVQSNTYNIDLSLKGKDVNLEVLGDYALNDSLNPLDFKINLNKIGMKTIAGLAGESLDDASGNINGNISLKGSPSEPKYKGDIQFNDATFNVTQLDSKFKLSKDKIELDQTKIAFSQFTIEDEENNKFTLDGSILTEDLANPEFDLGLKANNFQAISSTKKDNEEFYGDLNFDIDGTIKGNLNKPIVDVNLGINENTNFTYVLLDAQAQLESRDGIVEFVNKENPDNILTRTDDSTEVVAFGGMDLNAKLKIDKGATFNVIVDPQTGDNLKVAGNGELIFKMEDNGRTTLSGRYNINDGHYNLSLYNLVKREFELERGSYIAWSGGGPMDAEMNVTAKYSVETSATSLMATQTAGSSEEVKNKYRQQLPFLVYLNVNGEIDQPRLNFNLGMPEDYQGAIDGTVYSRIKQLNNEEDALNKQVFSLLVLKKFYPNPGSDGSSGGTASIVRKNINQAISDQLNTYSDKLMGNTGVELNFGLNSYTDYQGETAEQRTDLNVTAQKKLLDDRLIVSVGSTVNVEGEAGQENSVVGNASIQYLLTEDGRWRLKGYRDSEYENVIDGQVFVNGIALIFQRQFNHFNELFGSKPRKEEEPKNEDNNKATNREEKSDSN
ncbi:translocation/assembly module TamB domain-containing protein [Brumimicrobium aurantiacum]|uniref:Translocation/assembly module TamB n=1 Tax=Brumimicrobium aurantiacum TaxID=1737063 RepID=A0A3E1EWG4_9FLAO|nr:translocation/assembly module TamB [Brumimicrobium aurantiacum]RFC53900.1 translocation/assembly module TamB [Brumimicrobium aurantiacum]